MPRPQFTLRAMLDAIGYEPAHRKVWIVAYGTAVLVIACFALLVFVVQRASNPGQDHYGKVDQLKADFDSLHVIPAANLFTKLRAPLGPLFASRSVFAATRGKERTSLYVQDVFGEFWKVTPNRFLAPIPPLATRAQLRCWYSSGVLSGRWDFTSVRVNTAGAPTGVSHDEFSVVLDDRNRMK